MLVSLAIYIASVPFAIVPLVGAPLAVTMVPYLSSALGTRFARPRERIPLALTTALIWSSIETALLLTVMRTFANITPMGFTLDRLGVGLIAIVWLSNMVFGTLGAVHPWKDPFPGPDDDSK
jgi:hypothetical protein